MKAFMYCNFLQEGGLLVLPGAAPATSGTPGIFFSWIFKCVAVAVAVARGTATNIIKSLNQIGYARPRLYAIFK